MSIDRHCFLVIGLENQPVVSVIEQDFPKRIEYKGASLREIEFDDGFLGFYDWLRDSSGRCFGVRITLHEAALVAVEALPAREYIAREGDGIFSVRLGPGEEDPDMSVDQEFSVSRIYVGDGGAPVLLIDALQLDESDLRFLVS